MQCPSLIASFGPALCQSVDIYCERTSESFFAEPLNATSNLAFFIAGWAAWRDLQRSHGTDDALMAMIVAFVPIVGLGSLAFHTFGTRWASWGDVIPILIFMLLYLWLVMRRYFGWPILLSATVLLVFFLLTFGLEAFVPEEVLWGGAMYLPTFAALLAIAMAPIDWAKGVRQTVFAAFALFLLSFTFRTLDAPLCSILPIGTHYMWHLLNALVLYLLIRAAILRERPIALSAHARA